MVVDFLTEIWMYELVIYSAINHAKKSYNLVRSEEDIVSDLMLIKKIFVQ